MNEKPNLLLRGMAHSADRCRLGLWEVHVEFNADQWEKVIQVNIEASANEIRQDNINNMV